MGRTNQDHAGAANPAPKLHPSTPSAPGGDLRSEIPRISLTQLTQAVQDLDRAAALLGEALRVGLASYQADYLAALETAGRAGARAGARARARLGEAGA